MDIHGDHGFRITGVEEGLTVTARWRGLMLRAPVPLLLPISSVHGFWLRSPLWLVGVDRHGTVTEVRLLRRRRLAWLRGARWILELPRTATPPRPGERLAIVSRGGEAESDAGTSLRVRHADREPGGRLAPSCPDAGRGRRRLRRGHPA